MPMRLWRLGRVPADPKPGITSILSSRAVPRMAVPSIRVGEALGRRAAAFKFAQAAGGGVYRLLVYRLLYSTIGAEAMMDHGLSDCAMMEMRVRRRPTARRALRWTAPRLKGILGRGAGAAAATRPWLAQPVP